MKCTCCGNDDELRLGVCFDCASAGEAKAAKRTVDQHLRMALHNLSVGYTENARFDIQWAIERFTGTGDYAEGGYFDRRGIEWR